MLAPAFVAGNNDAESRSVMICLYTISLAARSTSSPALATVAGSCNTKGTSPNNRTRSKYKSALINLASLTKLGAECDGSTNAEAGIAGILSMAMLALLIPQYDCAYGF